MAHGLEFFKRRRETAGPTTEWDPIDSDRDLVVVEQTARPYDPPRRGDTPTRPAEIQIAHTGIRHDTSGRLNGDPALGLHVAIERQNGIPRGRQKPLGDPVNINRPPAIAYGSLYELDGLNAEEGALLARISEGTVG